MFNGILGNYTPNVNKSLPIVVLEGVEVNYVNQEKKLLQRIIKYCGYFVVELCVKVEEQKTHESEASTLHATFESCTLIIADDDADQSSENLCGLTKERSHATGAFANQFIEITNEIEVEDKGDDEGQEGSPDKNFSEGGISAGASIPCQKLQEESRKTVAFVSVSQPTLSQRKQGGIPEKEVSSYIAEAADNKEDSVFSLFK
ncbi:hypothetical protein FRX31_015756 [Thalictrum thalictroides]|uniref:Uncharacterized protein n=1 Tax=Thalictrum thalictroides TaxID=46969 RepID=A0A7J6WCF1_THATH|nr:hypothetical protein FRX31_015756 [Thalictrum thalictroides]